MTRTILDKTFSRTNLKKLVLQRWPIARKGTVHEMTRVSDGSVDALIAKFQNLIDSELSHQPSVGKTIHIA